MYPQKKKASVRDLASDLQNDIQKLQRRLLAYQRHADIMEDLLRAGEPRRLERSRKVDVKSFTFKGNEIKAVMHGSRGATYKTSLVVQGQGQQHNCDCPDFRDRGHAVGPCKHILHLGRYWLNERVGMQLEKIAQGLSKALN